VRADTCFVAPMRLWRKAAGVARTLVELAPNRHAWLRPTERRLAHCGSLWHTRGDPAQVGCRGRRRPRAGAPCPPCLAYPVGGL